MTNEERRAEQQKFEGDVVYAVWRSGGNPDAIDPDRLYDRYWNDENVDDSARAEMRLQRTRSSVEIEP